MTISKRGDSYRVRVFSKRDPVTGERHALTGTFKTMREAREAETDFKQQLRNAKGNPRDTLGAYLDRWHVGRKMEVAITTWKRQGELVETAKGHMGHLRLRDVTPDDLKALYVKLLSEGRKDGVAGLSPQTVVHVHRVLHKALDDAFRSGSIYRNPASLVRPPKIEKKPVEVPEPEALAAFIKSLRGDRIYPLVMLLHATGMRRGEACGLKWADIDIDRLTVTVRRNVVRIDGKSVVKAVKTESSVRSIPFPTPLVAVIEEHRTKQRAEMLHRGYRNPEGFFMTNTLGDPVNPDAFTSRVRTLAQRANIKLSPHALRHAHATMLLLAGIHPKIAQERLGHATINVTMDVYSHVLQGMQDSAVSATERALAAIVAE